MRSALLTGVLLAAVASPAVAQPPGPSGGPGPQGPGGTEGGANPMMMGGAGPMGMQNREMMTMAGRLIGELARGTFYRVRRGDEEVVVHCPQGQPLALCIQGAGQLMADLAQMPPSEGGDENGDTGNQSNGSGGSGGGQSNQ